MKIIELFFGQDYVVREVRLTPHTHGYVDLDEDGRANVYVNEADSDDRKIQTIRHELLHHAHDDYYVDELAAERMNRIRETRTAMVTRRCGNG